jgi:hypothetical protein
MKSKRKKDRKINEIPMSQSIQRADDINALLMEYVIKIIETETIKNQINIIKISKIKWSFLKE